MNERIIELAEQAGFENGHQDRYGNSLSQELEKFAELIVMECLTICEELGDKGMDGHYCADKINKTFRS
jgi:hypothetical protein